MSCTDKFQIDATIVANEFIEKYMPEASGDYVKVYLYLLKNRAAGVEISAIADALHMTDGDVRRAIRYWEDKGIVSVGRKDGGKSQSAIDNEEQKPSCAEAEAVSEETVYESVVIEAQTEKIASVDADTQVMSADNDNKQYSAGVSELEDELRNRYKNTAGKAILNTLSEDEEFGQLLFIVQKYRAKILTEREQEVLAYLYHGLHIPCEVIDYLVAYCVENQHNNMRYIEKVGLDWARAGIKDVRAAKRRTSEIDKMRRDTAKKNTARVTRQGITRNNDLDDWVKAQVLGKL